MVLLKIYGSSLYNLLNKMPLRSILPSECWLSRGKKDKKSQKIATSIFSKAESQTQQEHFYTIPRVSFLYAFVRLQDLKNE